MSTKVTFAYVKPTRAFTVSGNDLYYTDGNVGIGKSNPSVTLDVSGNFAVDGGLLFVDGSNNRVGISKTNPAVALDVSGSIAVTGNSAITGNLAIGKSTPTVALDVSGNFAVDGNTLYVDASNNRVGIGKSDPSVALDISGYIKSSIIAFHAIPSTTASIANSTGYVSAYTNALHNIGGGYSTVTGTFTAPASGYYFFSANAYFFGNTSSLWFYKNNSIAYGGHWNGNAYNSADIHTFGSATALIQLNTNDTVRLFVISNSGTSSAVRFYPPNTTSPLGLGLTVPGNYFCGYLINLS